jgi:phosphatidylglycerol:prolipoprotein diacylglycerol transferase
MMGLALGRIGCLLNGCCYGGLCEHAGLGVRFPVDSPPYEDQRSVGLLYGFRIQEDPEAGQVIVDRVLQDTPAMHAGLSEGAVVRSINGVPTPDWAKTVGALMSSGKQLEIETDRGIARVALREYPARSLPIHATQIYSAINAGLLCLLTWAWYPFRRRDGEVFALMLTVYPITRLLLEQVRTDEPGQFGTALTISQMVSLALLFAVAGLWAYLARQPRGSVLPIRETTPASAG